MSSVRGVTTGMLVALILAMLVTAAPVHSAPAAQDNLLRNPSFEGGVWNKNGDSRLQIPNEWDAWWAESPEGCENFRPNFNLSTGVPERIHEGAAAASYWARYQTYNAGLIQQVSGVTSGTIYRFVIWGHMWSTTDDTSKKSDSEVRMRIGIDPTGGTNPFSDQIVWSDALNAVDTYQKFTVEATAQNNVITVFTKAKPNWCVTQSDTYWDDAKLTAVGEGAAVPTATTASGGEAPAPTSPPSSGVPVGSIPQSTPAPDGSVVHTVQPGETLIGIAVTYDVTLDHLRELNNLTTDMVFVGQQLVIRLPPTPTPAPPATPTPAEVAEEPAVPAEPQGNGTICVMSYEDINGNGSREPDEAMLAGISFMVSDGAQTVGTYITTGVSEPYCFPELAPGSYIVSWSAEGYTPTSDQRWVVSLSPGATVTHDFGAQAGEGADAADEAGEGALGLPRWAVALIVMLGIVFLLGGIGALGYFVLMRRAKI